MVFCGKSPVFQGFAGEPYASWYAFHDPSLVMPPQVRLVEEALLRWLSENKRADTKVAQVQRSEYLACSIFSYSSLRAKRDPNDNALGDWIEGSSRQAASKLQQSPTSISDTLYQVPDSSWDRNSFKPQEFPNSLSDFDSWLGLPSYANSICKVSIIIALWNARFELWNWNPWPRAPVKGLVLEILLGHQKYDTC